MRPLLRRGAGGAAAICTVPAVVVTLVAVVAAAVSVADARGRHHGGFGFGQPRGVPGDFDYYVLVLSWSPSFCAAAAERDPDRAARNPQCGPRPFTFVVHGLWPQYERGYPQFCTVPAPRLSRRIVTDMLDLMPAPQLVYHEWDRHGVCSGLSQDAFFDTVRRARAAVTIPPAFAAAAQARTVSPDEVEDAFVAANPGMPRDGFSVTCSGGRLSEVRICMTRDLGFRGCEQLERRACQRDRLVMPPARGG